jgi:hypothetical protein
VVALVFWDKDQMALEDQGQLQVRVVGEVALAEVAEVAEWLVMELPEALMAVVVATLDIARVSSQAGLALLAQSA